MGQKGVNADGVTDGSKPLRDRQETFCQIYAIGKTSATESYRQAGYSQRNADVTSAKLLGKVGIKARIAYIQADRACKEGITRDGQTRKLAIVAARCLAAGEHSTYVRAVEATNRMYGLDKQVIETTMPEPMSRSEQQEADEWAEFRLWKASRTNVVGIHTGSVG